MTNQLLGSGSPKSFQAYPRADFDLESGNAKIRRSKISLLDRINVFKSMGNCIHNFYKLHPVLAFLALLLLGVVILIVLSIHESHFRMMGFQRTDDVSLGSNSYPFANLHNLVMVAGHSIYTNKHCESIESEDSWFLEPYQKYPGQAATFVAHIKEGVKLAAKDDNALLLFSGGETRKDAGPRSEALSYWGIAESNEWFGKQDTVRNKAVTEEHARDSYENLLFSVCRFRELTGTYPRNITVVGYDFKGQRFSHLHRMAIGFPKERFFYAGTPVAPGAKESAVKGEEYVRKLFEEDPYGCFDPLHQKRLKRDPYHRFIPYPGGCPELVGLFSYCGPVPYPGSLPWSQ